MKHKTFFWFILPTTLAMLIFIAFPIVSVIFQSVHTPHDAVFITVENCSPFGCQEETIIDQEATEEIRAEKPLGQFVGLQIYLDRGHLAVEEVKEAWSSSESLSEFFYELGNLPFYRAMGFTMVYTSAVTPLVIILGLLVALCVNSVAKFLKGITIFFSLLPMIVTPLIGALVLYWMLDSRGVLGNLIQAIVGDPEFSLKASTPLTWLMLIIYGVWSGIPFSFIVLYAGLQTLPKDQIESSMIDGASRWDQLRYVVVPHLIPLVTFIALMQLMDNFRVFEPIVGFSAEAHATSLSWIIFNDLSGETRQLSAAAVTSVMTIIGVMILLTPVMIRTWRDFRRKT